MQLCIFYLCIFYLLFRQVAGRHKCWKFLIVNMKYAWSISNLYLYLRYVPFLIFINKFSMPFFDYFVCFCCFRFPTCFLCCLLWVQPTKLLIIIKKEGSTARPVPSPLLLVVVVVDAYRTIDNCATNNRVSVIRQHNFEYRRTACPSFCLAVFDFDCLRFGCKFCDSGPRKLNQFIRGQR